VLRPALQPAAFELLGRGGAAQEVDFETPLHGAVAHLHPRPALLNEPRFLLEDRFLLDPPGGPNV
jgi:hypothetical protein